LGIDEVHLTKDSSFTYVNGLLYNADTLFTAELIDLEAGTSKKSDGGLVNKEPGNLEAKYEKSVKDLEKKLEELNRCMFRRRFSDNLVAAGLREDVDTISNQTRRTRC
jgi:hypothetical protein